VAIGSDRPTGFLMTALSSMQNGLRSWRGPVKSGVHATDLPLYSRTLSGSMSRNCLPIGFRSHAGGCSAVDFERSSERFFLVLLMVCLIAPVRSVVVVPIHRKV
jgi:hypothetical protein